jgi:hypothetical protein
MRQISPEEAEKNYGIKTKHNEMDNGQLRFRLEKDDGTKYVLTIEGNNRAWQDSHSTDSTCLHLQFQFLRSPE